MHGSSARGSSPIGPLPQGWQLKPLKKLTTKIGSGATPRGGSSVYLSERLNYALIRSQSVFDRSLDLASMSFIDDEQSRSLRGVELRSGDVLLNITGDGTTFGRCCMVKDEALPAVVNQHVAIIRTDPDILDPGYLLSYMVHPTIKNYVEGFNAGGSRRALTKGHIENFEIAFPPLPEQRAIAATLGALDEKIELNRRMNETLEAMARALFRDWFTGFGPTRAKMAGHTPYLSPDLWALFPDKLDEEGKPEGWERKGLLSQAELISGGTPKTDNPTFWNGEIPWASAKDVSQCKDCFLIETERTITRKGLEKSATKVILQYSTVVVARGATTGRYCIFGSSIAMNQTCYALASKFEVPFWLNLAFGSLVDKIIHAAHGSVFDTITTQTLLKVDLPVPSVELLRCFEGSVAPLFNKILNNQKESRTLAETRDLLLPRLMSGELCVIAAERIVEAVL